MRPFLSLALASFALAACVSDPYAPVNARIDPSAVSERSEDGQYSVIYRGSPGTSSADVYDLALLRAATITLQKGGDWFEIINEFSRLENERRTQFQRDPFAESVAKTANCGVLGCPETPPRADGREFFSQSFEIMVHEGAMPVGANGYDAVSTSARIRAKYTPEDP